MNIQVKKDFNTDIPTCPAHGFNLDLSDDVCKGMTDYQPLSDIHSLLFFF